jgi:hypothetical protein
MKEGKMQIRLISEIPCIMLEYHQIKDRATAMRVANDIRRAADMLWPDGTAVKMPKAAQLKTIGEKTNSTK